MRESRAIMVLGTSPRSAKSVLTIALCRVLSNRGYKICPFKAVSVIQEGAAEGDAAVRGRGLYHQCQAARVLFEADMNPVVVRTGDLMAGDLFLGDDLVARVSLLNEDSVLIGALSPAARNDVSSRVRDSYLSLRERYDYIVIEGGGSPVDLPPEDDIPNILTARAARAPIILSCKFSRGGGAAALVGTVNCLPPEIRELVAGFSFSDAQSEEAIEHSVRLVEDRLGISYLGTIPRVPLWASGIDSYELLARTACDRLDWRVIGDLIQ